MKNELVACEHKAMSKTSVFDIKIGIKKDPSGSQPDGRKKGKIPMHDWHRLRAVSLGLTARVPRSAVLSVLEHCNRNGFQLAVVVIFPQITDGIVICGNATIVNDGIQCICDFFPVDRTHGTKAFNGNMIVIHDSPFLPVYNAHGQAVGQLKQSFSS